MSDSSPLIGLEQIGQIELLQALFADVVIPPAVAREISPSVRPRTWIRIQALTHSPVPAAAAAPLGPGEREAIQLTLDLRAGVLILDDEPARRIALEVGLPVMGTAGLLIAAKQRGLIADVKSHLDALIHNRFFLSQKIYDLILRKAGE